MARTQTALTQSEMTASFTKKAWKAMLRKPTEVTSPFRENLRVNLGRAINRFFNETGNCPESVELSEIRTGSLKNQLIVTILVHGKKGNKNYTFKHVCRWIGVKFIDDSSDKIRGDEDARTVNVNTGDIFSATGDIIFSNLYPLD